MSDEKKLTANDIDIEIDKIISEFKEVASIKLPHVNPDKVAGLHRND